MGRRWFLPVQLWLMSVGGRRGDAEIRISICSIGATPAAEQRREKRDDKKRQHLAIGAIFGPHYGEGCKIGRGRRKYGVGCVCV